MPTTILPTKATGITVINKRRIKKRGNSRKFNLNMLIQVYPLQGPFQEPKETNLLIHFAPVTTRKNPTICFGLILFLMAAFPLSHAVPLEWVRWSSSLKVALTFDDGPRPTPTALLCEILARYHVPSTFFVVGRVADQYPEVLRLLADQGHEVSNHTWNHPDVRFISTQAMRQELDRTRLFIQKITGQSSFLFRTPGGSENYLRKTFHIPTGYQLVLWDVHSHDQEGISADQIVDRVLSQVKDGDVILMHNGLASTREALDIIIPTLQRRGFEFVTVSKLLQNRPRSVASLRRATFLQGLLRNEQIRHSGKSLAGIELEKCNVSV
jgi:peptidoglycan/xylan/chitin deacetylase (PgdA/CDA1 family)